MPLSVTALLHISLFLRIFTLVCGGYDGKDIVIRKRGAFAQILMHVNENSTVGDVRQYIHNMTRRAPGSIYLGSRLLGNDSTLLADRPIASGTTIEYDLPNTVIFNATLSSLSFDIIKTSFMPLYLDIGSNTFFADAAAQIKKRPRKNKWFTRYQVENDEVNDGSPILF